MWMRSVGLGATAALLLALFSGCKKPSSADSATVKEPQPAPQGAVLGTVGRLHWLGKKQLSGDTNASYFLGIWNLPESARLQDQTLDKLATAIAGGLSASNASIPNGRPGLRQTAAVSPPPPLLSPSAALIRPLLADLVAEEFYLEIGAATNQPGELFLAVRLNNERASAWATNLTATLTPLMGASEGAADGGSAWYFSRNNQATNSTGLLSSSTSAPAAPQSLRLNRAGDWTVLSLAYGADAPLLSNALARIQRGGAPFAAPATNYWMEASLDLPNIARALALNWRLPTNCPGIQISLHGEGESVRTLGSMEFPQPLSANLQPWDIPTNLIHDPLLSFCAVRGVGSFLKNLPAWKKLGVDTAPNQIFIWSQAGMPSLEYLAAPWPGASNVVHGMAEHLQTIWNPWLASKSMGHLSKATLFDGLVWESAPFITPQLGSIHEQGADYVLAGLVPLLRTNLPPPRELLDEVKRDQDRLCYAWEMTGLKLDQVLYLSQLFRLICKKAQLGSDSAGLVWLTAATPKLKNCITVASLEAPRRIGLNRKSSVGFTAAELTMLVDWLESPRFPFGLHSELPANSALPGGPPSH